MEGKLFFGLQILRMTTGNTTKNYLDTPEESKSEDVEPTIKTIVKDLGEGI